MDTSMTKTETRYQRVAREQRERQAARAQREKARLAKEAKRARDRAYRARVRQDKANGAGASAVADRIDGYDRDNIGLSADF